MCYFQRERETAKKPTSHKQRKKKILNAFLSNRLLYFKRSSLKYSSIFLSPTHLQIIVLR